MSKEVTQHQGREGYEQALKLLHRCITLDGFIASPGGQRNYRRIWARDGVVLGLAALMTQEQELIDAGRRTLETLARFQGPHGEIPSNVDTLSERVSYGGTTGRVDADLWFIIGCGEYWKATGDEALLQRLLPVLERVHFLLGAWEFNNRGLLYVPLTGDWADEYLHGGYVLYDQLLYLQAMRVMAAIHAALHGGPDHALQDRINRLRHLIRANYWFDDERVPADAYHAVLYAKGLKAARHCAARHWLPAFSPSGYGYRFDAFANILVALFGVADARQRERVDRYIDELIADREFRLLPAFSPVISPVDEDWEELQVMFSYTFRNRPQEYHNGGLWPMLSGFYVADRARRDPATAAAILHDIHRANALPMAGQAWGFPEYLHGRTFAPGGTPCLGWSAAGAIIGQCALQGRPLFTLVD